MPTSVPRRRAALALVLAVAVPSAAMAACGGGGDDRAGGHGGAAKPARGGTLTMLFSGDVDSLDPGITYYNGGYLVQAATQRPLLSFKPGRPDQPVPDLARSAPQVSADGRTVTVAIRGGVRFSPPVSREVTAADVEYAIERGFFRTVNNPYASSYFADVEGAKVGVAPGTQIRGIETPDAHTLVFHLSRSTGAVLAGALALPLTAPVPAREAAPLDARNPSAYADHESATGPYMVAADARGKLTGYQPGRSITLVRNPRWRAATDFRPAYVDRVEIKEGNNDTTVAARRILAGHGMLSGEWGVPGPALRAAIATRKSQLAFVDTGGFDWITLNTAEAPFDDLDVRRAVVAAVDRTALRLALGGSLLGPIATHFIPPGTPGFDEAGGASGTGADFLRKPAGDGALAASYMRKAGYASGRYDGHATVLLASGNDPANLRVGEIFEHTLQGLGFKVKLRPAVGDVLYTKLCGSPAEGVDACSGLGWSRDFADAQTVLLPTLGGQSIAQQNNPNQSQLKVPAIDAAMAKATTLVDPDQRAQAWAAIDRQVTAQAPAVPIVWEQRPVARSADVVGVTDVPGVSWSLSFSGLRATG